MSGRTVVLGLGNPLMGDDGFGLYAMSHLQDDWFTPSSVEFVDGGTWGLSLLPVVDGAERLLVLDAIDLGRDPGTVIELRGHEIPAFLERTKLSPHQVDLRDVLALCEWRGTLPANVAVVGVQPERVELSSDLSPKIESALGAVVACAAARLQSWGVECFEHVGAAGPSATAGEASEVATPKP
ncbi:MAG: HyaD/HybD family hydrogenase maturation endopeptidase [Gemmatimonadaceae bacterium]